MHPNTEHLVISLKDSLACGAHYYCLDHMLKTLHAVIAEHFTEEVTNADHPKCILMVMQWTLAVRDRLMDDGIPARSAGGEAGKELLNKPSKYLSLFSMPYS